MPRAEIGSGDDLTTFVDDFVGKQLATHRIPGAAFAWVENGRVRVLRGYGIADARTATHVDPQRTIFQVGSLSKPVTAMGALKLARDHKLDPNQDLSPLFPELPAPARSAPITLHQMLTHTSGFDPVFVDIGVDDPKRLLDLRDVIRLHCPPRTIAPGEFVLYNNFGFTLAGRTIERVSGLPFDEYMRREVLDPLEMRDSSFAPRAYEALAHGHDWINGRFVPVKPFYVNDTPAGGMTTTANDMAKFIIAVLADDSAHRVLCDEDAERMRRCQFTHHPQLDGLTYGFEERTLRGERTLEHGGVWNGFTCKLLLLPERHAGFFVVYNRYDPRLLDEITRPLLAFRCPKPKRDVERRIDPVDPSLAQLVGEYRNSYFAHGTIEKLRVLWKSPARVYLDGNGQLMVQEPGENARRVHPAGELLFATRGERPSVYFRRNSAGDLTQLIVGTTVYDREHWWDAPQLHLVLIGTLAFCFILAVPVMAGRWSWALFRHRRVTRSGVLLRVGEALCATCNAIFIVLLARLLVNYEMRDIVYGLPAWFTNLTILPSIAAICSLCAVMLVIQSVRSHEPVARIARHAFFAIMSVGFIPLLAYWNLLTATY
jgi:CubicO group peptidase (beta-lactamase class C family)